MTDANPVRPLDRLWPTLRRLLAHPWLLYFVVCVIVWLPDGLNIGPDNDGWRDLGPSPMHWHRSLRFFGQLPKVLGQNLVRDGFQGWELMLFIVTVLRGVVAFEIFRRLFPRYRSFAVACGLLALFHPADGVYFWMDSVGLDFSYVIALGICLAAVVHLQTGSRESLLALVFLQVILCFTYTAYLPFVFGFAIGIAVLRHVEGHPVKPAYLVAATLPTLLGIGFQTWVALRHHDREGKIMDLRAHAVADGYLHELKILAPHFNAVFSSVLTVGAWAILAAVPAALGYFLVRDWHGPPSEREKPETPRYFYVVLVLGLLALAALGYLPYAISKVRFGAQRQMLVAGLLIYAVALIPVFFWALPRLASRAAEGVVLALLAAFICVNGLENRSQWVKGYRNNETFLAALAAAVPHPAPGTTIVVQLHTYQQTREVSGLQHLRVNFQQALRYMYGDASLNGAFLGAATPPVSLDGSQAQIAISDLNRRAPRIKPELSTLLLIDYSPAHELTILDQQWLRQHTPPGSDVSAYQPTKTFDATPGQSAIMCSMFEKDFRPPYCTR